MDPRRYLFFVEQDYSFAILRPLQDQILLQGGKVEWFLSKGLEKHLKKNETHIKSYREVKQYQAHATLAPGNLIPPSFPGLKVALFHGFAIEKRGHFRIRGWFDLYCTHGPLTTIPFKKLAQKHKNFCVVETGWPKLDGIPEERPNKKQDVSDYSILYAPTFSPSLSSTPYLYDSLKQLLSKQKYNLSVKFHPLASNNCIEKYATLEQYSLKYSKTQNFLSEATQADIVLTDTSSTIVEALYLGKPVLTFNNSTPHPHLRNFTEPERLEDEIQWVINNYDSQKQLGLEYANQMHPYRDGKSSKRVLEAIEAMLIGEIKPHKKKPLNLIRRWKLYLKKNLYL